MVDGQFWYKWWGGQPLHKQWMVNLVVIFTRNGEYKVRCKVTNSVLFASVDMGNISIKIHRCIISIIPIYLVYHTFIYKILFSFKSTHRSFHRRKLKYIYQKKVFVALINNKWVRGLYSWFGENSALESKIAWLDIDRTAIKFFQNKKLVCCWNSC